MTAPRDITGQRFGRLVAVSRTSSVGGKVLWRCQCDCGQQTVAYLANLCGGRTQSCGCYNQEQRSKRRRAHGESGNCRGIQRSRLYIVWTGMQQRCHNPNNPSHRNYGARGIEVCERWRSSFEAFRDDMGEPPSLKASIERIDNDGPYSLENCRWADAKTQCRNRRKTLRITYQGITASLAEHAEAHGIAYDTLVQRVMRYGWSVDDAIETPTGVHRGWRDRR